ncbi:CPBP family intramembrane glutamic endopeptidase [Microbacterium sp. NIBRBAC000506063]|uniref:CPBP family intramembrane glutamic endopeptidase n=1 Tax=Microbacterium sp. NIBRBAC000506063 TaxID=2734618 RepID=UPI001BB50D41|nr:type II CAAX endopeptidase family protein [Microbacterium sp. NIBRBAC000506063]QTV79895.1 CPBP family intramembrane metalloprotease [Microbacterium sp. NIBRBAC000506063]
MTTAPAVPWRAVIVFIVTACALAWLVVLPLWLGDGLAEPWAALILPAMMFTPLLATLLVVFALRTPPDGRLRFLGMWPLRPAKRVVWMSVLAIFGPPVIVATTMFAAAALGLVTLDLTFGALAAELEAAAPGMPFPPVELVVALQLLLIPFGAILNSVLAFGEEIGWRGWLVPALRPLGTWPALLLSGAIWGLWHSPIILLGYNFGRTDVVGVLLMTGGCVAWGVLFGWLRLRTGSVWPAVFAHGALNAAAGMVLLFAAPGEAIDLALAGPLGLVSWGVIAVIVVVLALTGQLRRQPGLAAPAAPLDGPPPGGVG